jgi:hypothetical protein
MDVPEYVFPDLSIFGIGNRDVVSDQQNLPDRARRCRLLGP